ncbi:PREDICTED: protein NKG7 [Condylura cristata]|uniref:protein NKG7 n=1 Tax=Condylura cristata TaxID=143302 RepID=UPI000334548A|nr:PREDICTED: protein NKG7 [Condylura cristata]
MEPCRSLGLLAGCLGLICLVVALSTDCWFVAVGPRGSAHSGLWPVNPKEPVRGYIKVTQSFMILAAVLGLVSVSFLVLSCVPSLCAPGCSPLVSCITGFSAALCNIVAMAVYTGERWSEVPSPEIQAFFGWSFILGWLSVVFLLCTGGLSLVAQCRGPLPGYERM